MGGGGVRVDDNPASARGPAPKPWRRLGSEKCKVPNHVLFSLPTGSAYAGIPLFSIVVCFAMPTSGESAIDVRALTRYSSLFVGNNYRGCSGVAFSNSGDYLATVCAYDEYHTVKLFDSRTGNPVGNTIPAGTSVVSEALPSMCLLR